jgi:hypothetical protein
VGSASTPAAARLPGDAPGWWPAIWGVFLGYLFALLVLALFGVVIDVLGVAT